MALHPFVTFMMAAAVKAGRPTLSAGSPQQARDLVASTRAALGPGPDVGAVTDLRIPTRSGDIGGRLYRAATADERGLIVNLHGGGWVCGTLDDYDIVARNLVQRSGCALLQVDYRLAPEHPFPAGLEDVDDAIVWASEQKHALLALPKDTSSGACTIPLIVAGDSAGGNLAAVAVADLRGRVDIALQVLFYPVTDADFDRPSYLEHGAGLPLTRGDMQWFWNHYAPADRWSDPRISPLRRSDLAGLPPAFVSTAEYDVLRDEGEAYAEELRKAGVAVELQQVDGMSHGFVRLTNHVDVARDALDAAARAIIRRCDELAES